MEWNQDRFEREGTWICGAECLYRERPLFVHARVSEAKSDGNGLKLALEALPSPGFAVQAGELFSVGFSWDSMSRDLKFMGCPYISLFLYFDPDLVSGTVRHAATLPQLPNTPWSRYMMMQRYGRIADFIG